MALAAKHGRWRTRPEFARRQLSGVQPERAAALISNQLAEGSQLMAAERVAELFACYGLPALDPTSDTSGGVPMVVGVTTDPNFGPVVACGAGGPTGELLRDVAIRLTPVGDLDAFEMVRSLRTFPLLDGYRGAPPCDVASLEDALLRISAIVEAHREIVEVDCDPLFVTPNGTVIIGARVLVEDAPPPAPVPSLSAG